MVWSRSIRNTLAINPLDSVKTMLSGSKSDLYYTWNDATSVSIIQIVRWHPQNGSDRKLRTLTSKRTLTLDVFGLSDFYAVLSSVQAGRQN